MGKERAKEYTLHKSSVESLRWLGVIMCVSFQQLLQPSWWQLFCSAFLWTPSARPRGGSFCLGSPGLCAARKVTSVLLMQQNNAGGSKYKLPVFAATAGSVILQWFGFIPGSALHCLSRQTDANNSEQNLVEYYPKYVPLMTLTYNKSSFEGSIGELCIALPCPLAILLLSHCISPVSYTHLTLPTRVAV